MDYSKLKPMHGIIVAKLEEATESAGGIQFVSAKRLDHAIIVATGPGDWVHERDKKPYFKEVGVKVGDTVVVAPGSGVLLETEIGGEKETLMYMSEHDIVAVVRR
jgi:co-chaperonin GroES (HSP10)